MIYVVTSTLIRRGETVLLVNWTRKNLAAAVLGVVGLIALVFALLLFTGVIGQPVVPPNPPAATTAPALPPATPPTTRPVVSFASPSVGEMVTADGVRVFGTVSGLAAGDRLWLVTLANPRMSGDTYQPQDTSCVITGAGEFDCRTAYVGAATDTRSFDILITRVSAAAVDEFAAYHASNPEARGYPGLPNLPAGAELIGTVQVRRV